MDALLVVDFINEIVEPTGKLAAKGYADFVARRDTFTAVNYAIDRFRSGELPVIFVRLAFDPSYSNLPAGSPLFSKAGEFGILANGTWSTEIASHVDFRPGQDIVLVKPRVSAFTDTELHSLLHGFGVTGVYIAGVATDLAVHATALSAHDLDYGVVVIDDACAAASDADHLHSLQTLQKFAQVTHAASL